MLLLTNKLDLKTTHMKKYLMITFALAVFVVHTDDDMVHFLGDSLQSYDLLEREDVLGIQRPENILVENTGTCGKTQSLRNGIYPAIRQKLGEENFFSIVKKSISSLKETGSKEIRKGSKDSGSKNTGSKDSGSKETSIKEIGSKGTDVAIQCKKMDEVTVSRNGYVLFGGNRLRYDELYFQPQCWNGLLIFCTIVNTPKVIEDIFFLHTCVLVHVHDMAENKDRHMALNSINTHRTEYCKYAIDGRFLWINNRSYTFDTDVVGVYKAVKGGGVKYLVGLDNVIRRRRLQTFYGSKHMIGLRDVGNVCFVVMFVLGVLTVMYTTRSVKYRDKITDMCFRGLYFQRPCLVFVGAEKGWISAEKLKNSDFISVLFRGRYLFRNIKVTELSYQFLFHSARHKNSGANNNDCIPYYINNNNHSPCIIGPDMWTLTAHLNICPEYLGRVNKIAFREWIYRIVKTIKSMHAIGHVHGRLCPENIRITPEGAVKVQDIFDNDGWQSSQYLKNRVYPHYILTPADDVFSLGCAIHYYLTGYHPFHQEKEFISKEEPAKYDDGHDTTKDNYKSDGFDDDFITSRHEQTHNKPYPERFYNRESTHNGILCRILRPDSIARFNRHIKASVSHILVNDQIDRDFLHLALFQGAISLNHPFFWDWKKKIEFICDFSDYIAINPNLHKTRMNKLKKNVFQGFWPDYLDYSFESSYTRKYSADSLIDLIRLIRNSHRHFMNLLNKELFAPFEGGIAEYFMNRFPGLFMTLYNCKFMRDTDIFNHYYCE